jgi:hypothetical protein
LYDGLVATDMLTSVVSIQFSSGHTNALYDCLQICARAYSLPINDVFCASDGYYATCDGGCKLNFVLCKYSASGALIYGVFELCPSGGGLKSAFCLIDFPWEVAPAGFESEVKHSQNSTSFSLGNQHTCMQSHISQLLSLPFHLALNFDRASAQITSMYTQDAHDKPFSCLVGNIALQMVVYLQDTSLYHCVDYISNTCSFDSSAILAECAPIAEYVGGMHTATLAVKYPTAPSATNHVIKFWTTSSLSQEALATLADINTCDLEVAGGQAGYHHTDPSLVLQESRVAVLVVPEAKEAPFMLDCAGSGSGVTSPTVLHRTRADATVGVGYQIPGD